jgi:hypothetical protein
MSESNGAMAHGLDSVVFVAGSTDSDLYTPDEAVRLVGQNSLANFGRTVLM